MTTRAKIKINRVLDAVHQQAIQRRPCLQVLKTEKCKLSVQLHRPTAEMECIDQSTSTVGIDSVRLVWSSFMGDVEI